MRFGSIGFEMPCQYGCLCIKLEEVMKNGRPKIIMVDDNMANLTMGRNMLKSAYEVYPAPSAAKLFEILENVTPDLILLDIVMPDMNGYETIKKLKSDERYKDIPVIFLTAKNDEESELEGFDMGAVDYISKPFSAPRLLKRISNHLLILQQRNDLKASQEELKDYAENLEEKVRKKTRQVLNLQNAVITTVADLLEFRDEKTGSHIHRTQNYLRALTTEMLKEGVYAEELNKWDMEIFLLSSQLHDVGKIGISDLILNKPAKLTPEEFEAMKVHVSTGVDVIQRMMNMTEKNAFLNHALLVAGTHHERWDGMGYPAGLKGTEIPLEGRLMAIADVYDALISVRPYKSAFAHEDACAYIENGSGTHFDPALIDVFRKVKGEFHRIVLETGT